MIYITGDIHGDIDITKLNTKNFPQQKELTKEDYLIICGDFGLVWDKSKRERYWLNWLSSRAFTTIYVDGNHENFELLQQIPTIQKFGCEVQEVAPNIYHILRGQVAEIGGRTFFAMGGASSHDKQLRKEHISWWKEELPSNAEFQRALANLDNAHWKVDYVISHCGPTSIQKEINPYYQKDSLTDFFDTIKDDLTFKRWYFGHYHEDRVIQNKFIALYNKIIEVA